MAKIYELKNFNKKKQNEKQQNDYQNNFSDNYQNVIIGLEEFRNDPLFGCTEDFSKKEYEKVWMLVGKQYFTYYKTSEECKERRKNDKKFKWARVCEMTNMWNYKIYCGKVYLRNRDTIGRIAMKPETEYIEL